MDKLKKKEEKTTSANKPELITLHEYTLLSDIYFQLFYEQKFYSEDH